MNNQERIQNRIKRDKALKELKRLERHQEIGNLNQIFREKNVLKSMKLCRTGTDWKGGVQRYLQHGLVKNHQISRDTPNGVIDSSKHIKNLVIVERGKRREIKAVNIDDRIIQRTICDNALIPAFEKSLIYDNPASVKGKGITFARQRTMRMLEDYVKEYGTEGYAGLFDFKNFFGSIPHEQCYKVISKEFKEDPAFTTLVLDIIKSYQFGDISKIVDPERKKRERSALMNNKGIGITLGSQISQVLALIIPNPIDHYVKDVMGVKKFIRYMDDGLLLLKSKEEWFKILEGIKKLCASLGLTLNMKKTHITKLTHGFTFLKIKYFVSETKKIVRRLGRASIVRMRRKLKKFVGLVESGQMLLDDVYNSFMSWFGNAFYTKCYQARKSMLKLYNKLFNFYRTSALNAYRPKKKKKSINKGVVLV